MRRKHPWLAAAILLAALHTACNRDQKAAQLAALNHGFEAGLLTQNEYDAKKAMILGTGAPSAPPAVASAPGNTAPAVSPEATVAPPTQPQEPAPSAPAAVPPPTRRATNTPKTPPPSKVEAAPTPAETPQPQQAAAPPPPVLPHDNPPAQAAPVEKEEEPVTVAGCRDTSTKPGKEKGKQERFYPAPVAQVRQAAMGALEALEFKVNKNNGRELEATRKRHIGVLVGSGGEKMVLRFEDSMEGGQKGTLVVGETKKSIVLRAGQKSWTNVILTQTGCMLAKSGTR